MSDTKISEAAVEAAHAAYWAHPDDSGEDRPCIRAAIAAALPHLHPQPAELAEQQGVECGYVIADGTGEKFMAWGQVGPEWTADRSAALWLVRRADAEALAAENEDAWLILPVERCALPPAGWSCTLMAGHAGPCPTLAATGKQQVGEVQGDARRILAKHMRRIAAAHNVPRLATEADIVEGGEEYDFWMDAAHAAVSDALADSQPGAQEPVAEWVRAANGNYPELQWRHNHVARIGDLLYAATPGVTK